MRKRNTFAVLLIVCLLVLWMPAEVRATTYDGLTFARAEDGNGYYISSCDKQISGEITLPETYKGEPVVGIGESAFADCVALTCVNIPGSIMSIGKSAFAHCIRLDKVVIGNGVVSIAPQAFENCLFLRSIYIPESITHMGADAFLNCEYTSVYIANLSAWCQITFENGDANPISAKQPIFIDGIPVVVRLTIPSDVKSISSYAFHQGAGIAVVEILTGVETIEEYAFADCTNLSSVKLPITIVNIGNNAFFNCENVRLCYDGTYEEWGKVKKGYLGVKGGVPVDFMADIVDSVELPKVDVDAILGPQLTEQQIKFIIYGLFYVCVILLLWVRKKQNEKRILEEMGIDDDE